MRKKKKITRQLANINIAQYSLLFTQTGSYQAWCETISLILHWPTNLDKAETNHQNSYRDKQNNPFGSEKMF